MMAKRALLSFAWSDTSLVQALANVPRESEAAIAKVVADTTDRAFKIAKNRTPVDRGRARQGWKQHARGRHGSISNNVAYINVLEFGGYPVTPAKHATRKGGFRRGKALLGGAPPPAGGRSGRGQARTKRAPGGTPRMRDNVSKQAPGGMVRWTLEHIQPRFLSDLTDAINRLPSWT